MLYAMIVLLILLLLVLAGDVHPNPGPTINKLLSICHANVRSLMQPDKIRDIKTRLCEYYHIITLSETFLNDSIDSANLNIDGYNLHRKDRERLCGGVAAYVHSDIITVRRLDIESLDIEAMWLELRILNNKIMLCVAYRPPNESVDFWSKLSTEIENCRDNNLVKHLIVIGDLNAHIGTPVGDKLQDFCDVNHLFIHNYEPTRVTRDSATILDQIITNERVIDKTEVLAPVYTSDHCVLGATVNLSIPHTGDSFVRKIWNYNRADWEGFKTSLYTEDWDPCFEHEDIDNVWELWSKKFIDIIYVEIYTE
jgi:hypothetical protein